MLFGLVVFTKAQDAALDSLVKVLKTAPDDTNKLKLLDYLADNTPDGEWQKHSEEMGKLAQKLMRSNNASVQKEGKRYCAISLNNRAYSLAEAGDFKNALDVYGECTKIYNEIGDEYNVGLVITSIGAIYDRQGDWDNAIIKYREAIVLENKRGNLKDMMAALGNLGVIFFKRNQIDSALFYDYKAIEIAEQKKFRNNSVTAILPNIGNILEKKGDYTTALKYYERGFKMSEEIGDHLGKAGSMKGRASIYLQKGEIEKSLSLAKQALSIATTIANPNSTNKCAALLKEIYEKQGNYKEALKMQALEIASRDSMTGKENQKAVIRHQFQYEYDLKEATSRAQQEKKDGIANAELKRQKFQKIAYLSGFAVMLLFAGVFFRQRNKISREKKRSDELLLNILPEEVAEELKEKGSAEARLFEDVSVLFTDFKNFTGISEKLTAKELVYELHECFSGFDNIIAKYNIEKIKSVGDSYMAVSGLPTANPNHAEEMVKAAIEIREFMLNRKKTNPETFDARIGIHSGHVVAGIVGVKKFAYDIWGDTVNTAARMEQNSEAGKINISETTYEILNRSSTSLRSGTSPFTFEYRGEIEAKNKGKLKMYFVS